MSTQHVEKPRIYNFKSLVFYVDSTSIQHLSNEQIAVETPYGVDKLPWNKSKKSALHLN